MNTRTTRTLFALLGIVFTFGGSTANAAVIDPAISLNVKYTDPVIDSGPLSFGLAALPTEVKAEFLLGPGVPTGGGATGYGLADVLSASLPFGDGLWTSLTAFDMEVEANGDIEALFFAFSPLDTPSVSDGGIVMNSPLFITGTDIASGDAFSYTYANSAETITAIVPEPSTFILATLGLLSLGMTRRRGRR